MELGKRLHIPGEIDKEPELRDRMIILAYMEELATVGAPINLQEQDESRPPILGHIERINVETRCLEAVLSRALPGETKARDAFTLFFPMDNQRFRGVIRFVERSGYMKAIFEFPQFIHHGERRTMTRIRFGPRENATVTVLESLSHGHGAKGRLVNLSIGGVALRMDSAIVINTQRRLHVGEDIFQVGGPLDFIRVNGLPHLPMLECKGQVAHIARLPMGIVMGIRFLDMDPLDLQLLNQVVTKHAPEGNRGFPVRYPKAHREQQGMEEETAPEHWEDIEDQEGPELPGAQAATHEADPAKASDPREKLLRMKKCGKHILIIILDDLDRMIMAGTLQADGFMRIGEARSYLEAMSWLKSHQTDAVIVDHHIGLHTAQQLVEKLRQQGLLEGVPTFMLAQPGDIRATIQAKAAGIDRVVRYPVDYDGELKSALYTMLGLS